MQTKKRQEYIGEETEYIGDSTVQFPLTVSVVQSTHVGNMPIQNFIIAIIYCKYNLVAGHIHCVIIDVKIHISN